MRRKLLLIMILTLVPGALALAAEPAGNEPTETVRTLDAITIEGAVDVPQVLFITSRDNARFDDALGWTYIRSAEQMTTERAWPLVIRPDAYPATATAVDPEPQAEPEE
jgi:hypothetical protein